MKTISRRQEYAQIEKIKDDLKALGKTISTSHHRGGYWNQDGEWVNGKLMVQLSDTPIGTYQVFLLE